MPLTTCGAPTALSEAMVPSVIDIEPLIKQYRVMIAESLTAENRVSQIDSLTPAQRPSLLETVAPTIAVFEDRRRWAYDDPAGNRSVGIGDNLDAGDARGRLRSIGANYNRVRAGLDPLSEHQVDALFRIDITAAIEAAKRTVPDLEQHPQDVQAVVVDLCFNLGASGFAGLKSFRRHLDERDYRAAGRSLRYTHWYRQVGWRAKEDIEALMAVGANR